MAGKKFAWSYSALTGFETCPRQHYEMRIAKNYEDPPGEVQLWGIECHKHLEDRIVMGKQLPAFLNHCEPIIQRLESTPGTLRAEYKYALNSQFQPVSFFAPRGNTNPAAEPWVRAVGDVIKINGTNAAALDWKAGKFRDGDGQLRLQSAVMFGANPELQNITVIYAWLKDRTTTVRHFTRADVPAIWQEFLPRAERMRIAIEKEQFPPNPSGLCRKHCRVTSCPFHGKGAY